MLSANPYLNFNGDCKAAFDFYQSVLGGEFTMVMKFSDMPGPHMGPGEENRIMHIGLPIGGTMVFGSDCSSSMGTATHGNMFSVCIGGDDEAECRRVFNGLSEGGKVNMPFEKAPWGDIFGDFTDKFGVSWMVNCTPKQ
ncbi:VOC family protein [Chitinophaga sedimenti]|uniref:VOC family protein n=1 Tax=Chitinophaga sedimenti TaxID=2033606 RepID=UPI00200523F8|nr:VOC family protein [Chitinophaga sedimenti]MCK7554253.1 VOC family protein [Chitinophaga sedimenti]